MAVARQRPVKVDADLNPTLHDYEFIHEVDEFYLLAARILALDALSPPYGSVSSSQDQQIANAAAAQAITFDTNEFLFKLTHDVAVNNSRVYATTAGMYRAILTLQCALDMGANREMSFWFRKNGVDVARSRSVQFIFTTNDIQNTTVAFHIPMVAGDYIEAVMHGDTVQLKLAATAAQVGPVRPAAPSAVLLLYRIAVEVPP